MKTKEFFYTLIVILSLNFYGCASGSALSNNDYINQYNKEFNTISDLFFGGDFLNTKNRILSYNQLDTIAYNYESYAFLAECYKQLGKVDSGRIVYKNILESLKARKEKLYKNVEFAIQDLEKWESIYPSFPDALRKENGFVSENIEAWPIGGISQLQKNVIYPTLAKENRLQGRVIIGVLINEQGNAIDLKFYKTLSEEYDKASTDAIKRTKFVAPKRKGRACKMWVTVPILYN